jgi:hypothetical protein
MLAFASMTHVLKPGRGYFLASAQVGVGSHSSLLSLAVKTNAP